MRKLVHALAFVVVVAGCTGHLNAQQSTSTAETKQSADAALRDKAFNLLESLAGQLSSLQSAENRARIGANIADSIWKHDEKRARELFALVREDIKTGLTPPANYNEIENRTFLVFLKLRADTIERIAKHDPELAYEFFKATELSPDLQLRFEVRVQEHDLEMNLAKRVASSSPELALQLGRKALTRGFPLDLRDLLTKLSKSHKEEAAVLYKEIVEKIAGAGITENWEARTLGITLVHGVVPPDESTFRELINVFIKAAVASGCTKKTSDEDGSRQEVCQTVGSALPYIAKIDPRRAAELKRWEPERGEYSELPLQASYSELYEQEATVDDILALASRYPAMDAETIYWRAAVKAQSNGDFEQARKILSDFNGDPERKQMMLARIDENRARLTLDEEKVTEALKGLNEVPQAQSRVFLLMSLANKAIDRKLALKLLNQANGIVEELKPGREQDEAQVRLAFMYCLEKNDRGLAMMESLVPRLNEVVAAAIKLDGYDTLYLRQGEWNMSAEGNLGSLLTLLASGAGYFAWYDFDRAVTLAGQFERNEIRMMAQLKLAQSILSGPPKRTFTPSDW